jgi:hypothetical protein
LQFHVPPLHGVAAPPAGQAAPGVAVPLEVVRLLKPELCSKLDRLGLHLRVLVRRERRRK